MTSETRDIGDESSVRIEREASEWLLRLQERDARAEVQTAFEAWLVADPAHERIFRQQEQAWALMPHMRGLEDIDELMAPGPFERVIVAWRGMWNGIKGALAKPHLGPAIGAGVAACLALVLVLNVLDLSPDTKPLYATQTAEISNVTLADGSVVTLGAVSGMDVAFTETERRVTLSSGEAFFDIAKDPDRPFFVEAGDTVVRVVGTKFDVHLGAEEVRVSVLEGIVEVLKPVDNPDDAKQVLSAGQRAVAAISGDIAPIETVDTADVAPWRAGRLVYVDAPLKGIIADMNRYYAGDIALAEDEIGALEFTASFRTDQIDRMIEIMSMSLSLDARKTAGGQIVLTRRAQSG